MKDTMKIFEGALVEEEVGLEVRLLTLGQAC